MRQVDLLITSCYAPKPIVSGFTLRENYIDPTEEGALLDQVAVPITFRTVKEA